MVGHSELPYLTIFNFACSSDSTEEVEEKYNCIAWALGRKDNWWWPRQLGGYHWPDGLPREPLNRETVGNFINAFALENFFPCGDGNLEEGFEKLALYVDANDVPKHAARLLPSGIWTSKMGDSEDIEHPTLDLIEGGFYGTAKLFFKRKI